MTRAASSWVSMLRAWLDIVPMDELAANVRDRIRARALAAELAAAPMVLDSDKRIDEAAELARRLSAQARPVAGRKRELARLDRWMAELTTR